MRLLFNLFSLPRISAAVRALGIIVKPLYKPHYCYNQRADNKRGDIKVHRGSPFKLLLLLCFSPIIAQAAVQLNGDDDVTPPYYTLSTSPDFDQGTGWTIGIMARLPSTHPDTGTAFLISRGNIGLDDTMGFWLDETNGYIDCDMDTGPASYTCDDSGTDRKDATWYLHVFEMDSSQDFHYKIIPINGSISTEETVTGSNLNDITDDTRTFALGAEGDGSNPAKMDVYYVFVDGNSTYSDADLESIAAGTAPEDLVGQSFYHCWTMDGTGNVTDNCGAEDFTLVQGSVTDISAPPFGPQITAACSDDTCNRGETGVTVTGSGFQASQGSGTLEICTTDCDGTCDTQTVNSWNDTTINFDVVSSSVPFTDSNNSIVVCVTDNDSNNGNFGITFDAKSGWDVATLDSTPDTTTGLCRLLSGSSCAVDDQIEYETTTDDGATVTMTAENGDIDSNYQIGATSDPPDDFMFRIWTASDNDWTGETTESLGAADTNPSGVIYMNDGTQYEIFRMQ